MGTGRIGNMPQPCNCGITEPGYRYETQMAVLLHVMVVVKVATREGGWVGDAGWMTSVAMGWDGMGCGRGMQDGMVMIFFVRPRAFFDAVPVTCSVLQHRCSTPGRVHFGCSPPAPKILLTV